ncbi:MAG: hypothetical protein ACOCRK_06070 [bacterium]
MKEKMIQTQFDFSKNASLKEIEEYDRDKLHKCIVISEATSNNLIATIKKIIQYKNLDKNEKKKLKKLINIVDTYYKSLQTLDINLEKKRKDLLNADVKKQVFYFYKTGLFSQNQLGRLFGISQSTVSRIVKKLS